MRARKRCTCWRLKGTISFLNTSKPTGQQSTMDSHPRKFTFQVKSDLLKRRLRSSLRSSAGSTNRKFLSDLGRAFRWRPTTKKASTRPDSVAGVGGLELANVIFGKVLKYWPNCFWFYGPSCLVNGSFTGN